MWNTGVSLKINELLFHPYGSFFGHDINVLPLVRENTKIINLGIQWLKERYDKRKCDKQVISYPSKEF